MQKRILFLVSIFSLLMISCQTTGNVIDSENKEIQNTEQVKEKRESEISLLFAGDIMAHSTNYKYGNFDEIWKYVKPLVSSADLAFGNIEAPVDDDLDWSNYPRFNMHSSYVEAAIDAGFNVFSLANNHTNDQFLNGIRATKKYFDNRDGIWASGLKDSPSDGINYQLIEKQAEDGSQWKILFVAITEILNRSDASGYINFFPSNSSSRNELKTGLKKIAEENPHDLFIFSVHTSEPEYILKVTEDHKKFFRNLISECGVDIVWANHPHVTKEWEKLLPGDAESGLDNYEERNRDAFIMYANGNTISAQRTNPNFYKPDSDDDNTGDGVMIKVTVKRTNSKSEPKPIEMTVEPHFITTYITSARHYLIRPLDESFINALDYAEVTNWLGYIKARKEIMERILEKSKY